MLLYLLVCELFPFPPLESISTSLPLTLVIFLYHLCCSSEFFFSPSLATLLTLYPPFSACAIIIRTLHLLFFSLTPPHTPFHLSSSLDTSDSAFTPASFLSSFFTCLPSASSPPPYSPSVSISLAVPGVSSFCMTGLRPPSVSLSNIYLFFKRIFYYSPATISFTFPLHLLYISLSVDLSLRR